ncbi:MAG: hypothetical protein QW117_03135 [Candidatus Pacearchaeota archaeon]
MKKYPEEKIIIILLCCIIFLLILLIIFVFSTYYEIIKSKKEINKCYDETCFFSSLQNKEKSKISITEGDYLLGITINEFKNNLLYVNVIAYSYKTMKRTYLNCEIPYEISQDYKHEIISFLEGKQARIKCQ